MSRLIMAWIFLALTVAVPGLTGVDSVAAAAPADQMIRVGLWDNQQSVLISADSDFVFTGGRGEAGKFSAKEKAAVTAKDGSLAINGKTINQTQVTVKIQKADGVLEVNRRKYRGQMTIKVSTGETGVTVINTIPLEQYLYGIVAREVSPDWPAEAIKAQAVAARSYALHNKNKHGKDGYDVCATTDCQVYSGVESEAVRTSKAVDDTKGLVLTYKNAVIPAFFHSSSGGYTENSENVWGTSFPYLKGVKDFDDRSPHYQWKKEITPKDFTALLAKAGYTIGDIQSLSVSDLGKQPLSAPDRGVSGRVKSIKLTGSKGTVTVPGTRFRSLLGLSSTLFDVDIITSVPKVIDVPMSDSRGEWGKKKIELNVKPVERTGNLAGEAAIHRIAGGKDEKILFTGYGWGHGLGMSQWGAKAMAEQAPPGDKMYYKQILKHYYQGVDITALY